MADDDDNFDDILGPELAPALTPGRALQRRSRSYNLRPRKHSNDRMLRVLNAISTMPVTADACMLAGVSVSGLKYWLAKSSEGKPGDGFDVVFDPDEPEETVRFHDAWADAMYTGVSRIERVAHQRALGYQEIGVYQGRVIYRHDPELVKMIGYECMDTFLLDPITKQPVPESYMKQDPDMIGLILKARMPEVYGNKQQIDVNVRGGVLAIPVVAESSEALTDQSYKADAVDVEFSEVEDEEA